MIDIKQQELDKAFIRGVLLTECALVKRKFMPTDETIEAASEVVHMVIVNEIGHERMRAVQGENAKEPRA